MDGCVEKNPITGLHYRDSQGQVLGDVMPSYNRSLMMIMLTIYDFEPFWLCNLCQFTDMGVSINGGTPKWMVSIYKWKSHWKSHWNGWFRGTPISGNPHIFSAPGELPVPRLPKDTPTELRTNIQIDRNTWPLSEDQATNGSWISMDIIDLEQFTMDMYGYHSGFSLFIRVLLWYISVGFEQVLRFLLWLGQSQRDRPCGTSAGGLDVLWSVYLAMCLQCVTIWGVLKWRCSPIIHNSSILIGFSIININHLF